MVLSEYVKPRILQLVHGEGRTNQADVADYLAKKVYPPQGRQFPCSEEIRNG